MTRSAGDHRGAFGSDQEKCGHVVILVGLSGLAEPAPRVLKVAAVPQQDGGTGSRFCTAPSIREDSHGMLCRNRWLLRSRCFRRNTRVPFQKTPRELP
jgi:hypothetical protein